MNLFQGLPGSTSSPPPHHQQPLLCCSSSAARTLFSCSDAAPAYSLQLCHSSSEQAAGVTALQASVSAIPSTGVLLAACEQHGCGSILTLRRSGSSLQLQEERGGDSQQQLVAEFTHEGLFADLQPGDCQLLPGPVLLLQPPHNHQQPQQLVVMLPAAAGPAAAWQLLELELPSEALLQAAVGLSAASLAALAAAGPWKLLTGSVVQQQHPNAGVRLLLSLPMAQDGQHEQLKQLSVLLCLLQVGGSVTASSASTSAAAAAAATGLQQEDAGMSVVSCCMLYWQAAATCAAMLSSSSSRQRIVAVGSAAGDVALISFSSSNDAAPASSGAQQTAHSAGTLLASMQLPGAVQAVVHLPRAHVAGASHTDVLAVLFEQQQAGARQGRHGNSGSMAVCLVKLQGNNTLQQLATVQGVLGLSAPALSALGVLCPQVGSAAGVDSSALQLAAVMFLDSSSSSRPGSMQDGQPGGLGQCAWLDPGQCEGLPGPLLGVLAQAPPFTQGQQPGGPVTVPSDSAAAAAAPAGYSTELKGLQVMLAALEHRWQQDTRELCAMQHRTVTAQRIAAAAHQQMCQLAADTLYSSTVRQYALPGDIAAPDAALAVYHAGRQLAQQAATQQQQQPQVGATAGTQTMQLLLQVERISRRCRQQQLVIEVCLQPVLRCMQPVQEGARGPPSWSGALLQPCHAELLLWHAGVPALTASSSWCWDPITGQLSITAVVASILLLQIHDTAMRSGGSGCSVMQPPSSAADPATPGRSTCSAGGQGHVAHALAAAAERVANGLTSSSGSSSSSSYAPWEAVTLQAAVAVSACCSKQAVVQWEQQQQQQQAQVQPSQQLPARQQGVLQRSQLPTPAMAVLHLQPLEVSLQHALLQQLTGGFTQQHPAQAPTAAGTTAHVTAAVAATQTPAKAATEGTMHALHGGPGSLIASGLADVVPPTPCSIDGSEGDGPGVIPDSQSEDEMQYQGAEERRQQLQQWWQSQQQQQQQQQQQPPPPPLQGPAAAPRSALGAAAVAPGADGQPMDWQAAEANGSNKGAAAAAAAAAVDRMPASAQVGSSGVRRLLVRAAAAVDMQVLAERLQGMQCFQLVSSSSHGPQQQRMVLQVVSNDQGSAQAAQQQLGGLVELLSWGPQELHITLSSHSPCNVDSVKQLVLIAVRQLSAGRPITVHASPLDPALLGRLAAATSTLTDAALAHVQVLQHTLQQLPAASDAAGGLVLSGAGAAAAPELAECWVECLRSQAEVDLAVAQMCKASS